MFTELYGLAGEGTQIYLTRMNSYKFSWKLIRQAFIDINAMFTELYTLAGSSSQIILDDKGSYKFSWSLMRKNIVDINAMFTELYSGSCWTQLPQKLIVTPDIYTEEMDAVAGWSAGADVFSLNNTEFHSGTGSLKVKSTVGGVVTLQKTISWDLSIDSGRSLKLWAYPHSVPLDTITNITLYAVQDAGWANYYQIGLDPTFLVQYKWNLVRIIGNWVVGAGAPNWNNITIFRIRVNTKAGQVSEFSFDLTTAGIIKKPVILLTFDDCTISTYTKAFPILKAKNMVATSYVVSDYIDSGGGTSMTTSQIRELYANKWDIGNHTKHHDILTGLTEAQIHTTLTGCKSFLDGLGLTRGSNHVSYPGGAYDNTVISALTSWGAKTGRCGNSMFNGFDRGWPYELNCAFWTSVDSVAAIEAKIEAGIEIYDLCVLGMHVLVDAASSGPDWLTSQFSDLVDYIDLKGYQTLTISELERLYSGAITVNHK
jgi:peptidoglycan/xylan/chitin deacetylase (PgdA/CDA1 family)